MKLHLPPLLLSAIIACMAVSTTQHWSVSGSSYANSGESRISFETKHLPTGTQEQAANHSTVYNYTPQPKIESSFSIHATTAELQTETPQLQTIDQIRAKAALLKAKMPKTTTAVASSQKAVTTNAVAGVFNSINEASATLSFESAVAENAGITLAAEDEEIAVAAIDTTGYRDVEGTAAIYLKNGAASGDTKAIRSRSGYSYTYSITNLGSYLNANLGSYITGTTYWRGTSDYSRSSNWPYNGGELALSGGVSGSIKGLNLQEGETLHLGSGTGTNFNTSTTFNGGLNVVENGSGKATLGSYSTGAMDLTVTTLTGSGDLLLRGYNDSGTSSFAFSNGDYNGTISMTSNGGNVQLNAGGSALSQATIDFTNTAAANDKLDNKANSANNKAASIALNLTADATVGALSNGDSTASIVGNDYKLTVGNNSNSEHSYGGSAELGSLVKTGSNTQIFTSAITADSVSIEGGTLGTHGDAELVSVSMSNGATWSVGGAVSADTLAITGGSATITGSGANVTWNAPSTLDITSFTGNSAYLNLSNLTLNLNKSLTIEGYNGSLESGTTINFAQVDRVNYTTGNRFYLSQNGSAYTLTVSQTADNILQFTIGSEFTPPVEPDITASGILAVSITSDGLTASGQAEVTRSGYPRKYTLEQKGTFNNATWKTSGSSTNAASYWIGEANKNTSDWYGTSTDGIDSKLSVIQVDEGNALYLGGSDYKGTVYTTDGTSGDYAVIAAYDASTNDVHIAKLQGSGDVLLRGHSAETDFTIDDTSKFDGRLHMSAASAAVNLNAAGTALQNAEIDFDPVSYKSAFTTGQTTANSTNLNLTADATVGALIGGGTGANVKGNNNKLSVGKDNDSTHSFGGTVSNLNTLEKIGSNTQNFTGNVTVDNVLVSNGTMGTSGTLTADNVTIGSGATLSTGGTTNVGSLTLNGGATWTITGSESLDTLVLTNGSGTIRGEGENVTWTAPSTINISRFRSDSPWITLENLNFTFGSNLTLEGQELAAGTTIDFATLSTGAGYTGQDSFTIKGETLLYTLSVTTADNVLQLKVVGVDTRADLITQGIAAVYIENDGLSASGNTTVTYNKNKYTLSKKGSFNNATWKTSGSNNNAASYWIGEANKNDTTGPALVQVAYQTSSASFR